MEKQKVGRRTLRDQMDFKLGYEPEEILRSNHARGGQPKKTQKRQHRDWGGALATGLSMAPLLFLSDGGEATMSRRTAKTGKKMCASKSKMKKMTKKEGLYEGRGIHPHEMMEGLYGGKGLKSGGKPKRLRAAKGAVAKIRLGQYGKEY